jgi:hypothetical protein
MDLNPQDQARMMVVDYATDKPEKFNLDFPPVYGDTVVISFSLLGAHWRAIVIGTWSDEDIFVISYNAAEGRTYFNVYKKDASLNFNQRSYGLAEPAEDPQPAT